MGSMLDKDISNSSISEHIKIKIEDLSISDCLIAYANANTSPPPLSGRKTCGEFDGHLQLDAVPGRHTRWREVTGTGRKCDTKPPPPRGEGLRKSAPGDGGTGDV